jgi:ribosomal protein S18 acetylase RimI-like enzyme
MSVNETVQLRQAGRFDAERLKEIGVRGWETTYAEYVHEHNRRAYLDSDFWSIERLRDVLDDPYAINLAAEQVGVVVGFITTERLQDDRYEVTRLYVDPEIRSTGIGGRMLRSAFDELRDCGVSEVLVNVFGDNHAGRRFYERHGFELIEDTWCMVGDQRLSDVWYAQRLAHR